MHEPAGYQASMLYMTPDAWVRDECWQLTPSQVALYKQYIEHAASYSNTERTSFLDLLCRAISNCDDAAAGWTLHVLAEQWGCSDKYHGIIAGLARRLELPLLPAMSDAELANRRGINSQDWCEASKAFQSAMTELPQAVNNYAYCVERGLGDQKPNPTKARQLYKDAIARGSLAAYDNLAVMMQHGVGGPADLPAAVSLLKTGLEAGDAACGQTLGYLIHTRQIHETTVQSLSLSDLVMLEIPQLPPEHAELRNEGPGRGLMREEREDMVRLHGENLSFPLWQAPLYQAMISEDEVQCSCCGVKRPLVHDPERASGCFWCLAAGLFISKENTDWTLEEVPPGKEKSSTALAKAYEKGRKLLAGTPKPGCANPSTWPMHCLHPAVYLGKFGREDLRYHHATSDSFDVFSRAVKNGHQDYIQYILDEDFSSSVPLSRGESDWHMFRCTECQEPIAIHDCS